MKTDIYQEADPEHQDSIWYDGEYIGAVDNSGGDHMVRDWKGLE